MISEDLLATRYLWSNGKLLQDQEIALVGGKVAAIRPRGTAPATEVHLAVPLLTDLQVNGGGGTMVNGDPTPEGWRASRRPTALLAPGTSCPR